MPASTAATAATAASTLLLVAALTALTAAHGTPDNACVLGGTLEVLSTPGHLPVTSTHCDNVYDKQDFQHPPAVKYLAAKPGETYTLIMLDPDAPDRPRGVFYLHWILANIPGEDFRSGHLGNATEISCYVGPAPPDGTGLHRYMFYVYRHAPPRGRLSGSVTQADREFFRLAAYLRGAARLGVRLRGPLAGVQFRAAFELATGAYCKHSG